MHTQFQFTKSIQRASLATVLFTALLSLTSAAATPLEQAIALFDEEKYDEALKQATAANEADPKNTDAMFYLGRIEYELEDAKKSQAWLEKVVAAEPDRAEAHKWLGRAYALEARPANMVVKGLIAPKIRKSFERAVELAPKDVDARDDLIQFYVEAPGFLGGSVDNALAQAKEVEKLDPKAAIYSYGNIYQSTNQPAKAYETYKRGMEEFPDETDFYFQTGYAAANQQNWDAAFEPFLALTKRSPQLMGAHYQIGRLAALSGQRLELGEQSMQQYLQHTPTADEPQLGYAHQRLGLIYQHMKKTAEAKAEFETALKLNPENEDAKKALAAFK